ncbi:MAG: 1,4-alpha-glucan branching protein GlgB [Ferruginibacter sp.]
MSFEDENFIDTTRMVWHYSLLHQKDIVDFAAGKLFNAYDMLGAHARNVLGRNGYHFAVWAPHAERVSVIGEFNGWKNPVHPLYPRLDKSGIWEGFIPDIPEGCLYKFYILGGNGKSYEKADPYARQAQLRPETASLTTILNYTWQDDNWIKHRKKYNSLEAPWSVYEMHLGSWMRPDKNNHEVFNTYHETAERLVPYLQAMGFTHVEFMPVMEHPYDGSWGYQGTGYFAPTSRYGDPRAFMYLVDKLHQHGIGVILDWVPSHFPHDAHGLHVFDGAFTYEYEDMRKGYHPDWNSYIFNYKRGEVRSFLLSSAHFWLKYYHADGLRVDAVNSIIRLDFSRKEGEWEPNEFGGNGNLEAIDFLKDLNTMIYEEFSGIQTIAEEASDWPGITTPVKDGGFGFGMKWMMGWMHDIFRYMKKQPEDRPAVQNDFTFSFMYFYDEKFMLPISHDEIVHGKSPMIYKMPGNEWEQFANLRLLYTAMYTHPGGKLLFMGNEFGQTQEWNFASELQWELLKFAPHLGMQECVRTLNHLLKEEPALHELQFNKKGFEWEDTGLREEGILVYRRCGQNGKNDIITILNMTRFPKEKFPLKISGKNSWKELYNSDQERFWGSGKYLNPNLQTTLVDKKKSIYEIFINIPALGGILLK